MIKSYLVIEKGLIEERVFPVEARMSIGRSPSNAIYLSDPSISRHHASVYVSGDEILVEDLKSRNGTFVNGERVSRVALHDGDLLQVGNAKFRFFQERLPNDQGSVITQEMIRAAQEMLESTQDVPRWEISVSRDDSEGPSRRSRRIMEALAKTAVFATFDADGLSAVSQSARLVVYDRGRIIVQKGDRARSVYIILDGKVRTFTYDHEGKEVFLSVLSENQLFGEISLMTGVPHAASVQTMEETLVAELSFESMQEIMRRWPAVKGSLEKYYRSSLSEIEAQKRSAGLTERRRQPRLNEKVPVSFSIAPSSRGVSEFRGKVFRSISKDLSPTGIRIKVQDRSLLGLGLGSQLRLELSLPQGWGSVKCLGSVRDVVEGKEGEDFGYLGIEFFEIPPAQRRKLEQFIYS